ncbi:MAG: glycosyltransferase family 9 protein [Chitinophagales bacterium]|nr:glycosyltransferase family 9 protein [Chitinophagales bacterium]
MLPPPKKILVIRFSSIGDLVLTSPVYRCLKAKYPNAEVHLTVKKKLSSVLQHNPYIDKIIPLENGLLALASKLRSERYDYVIDLHNNLRSAFLKVYLGVPSSSVKKMHWDKWRMVKWKKQIKVPHIVDRYLETGQELGLAYDGLGLDHFTDLEAQNWLQHEFLKHYNDNPFVVFSIGGQFATKRLPMDKWKQIAAKLDLPIHVIGGKEDMEMGQEIQQAFPEQVINWTGKLTINQSAELIKVASKVFTNDTGMMHIAAAYNKDIDVFWGNTVPGFGMYPFYPDTAPANAVNFEVLGLSCRPCSKIGFKSCPKGHFNCMKLQEVG